ncbi:MAG TPA: hypothetical protein PK887_03720 [Ignavibacteriales bacterium]|nr:hypothetical protein [Ignavibacteriales bacterium]
MKIYKYLYLLLILLFWGCKDFNDQYGGSDILGFLDQAVKAPKGGMVLISPKSGTIASFSVTIKWAADTLVIYRVNIYMQTSLDNQWKKICENIPASLGKYTITQLPDRNCQIKFKIEAVDNVNKFVETPLLQFNIPDNFIQITQPDGTIAYESGSSISINWSYGTIYNYYDNIILQFSTDNGVTWNFLGNSYMGTRNYTWTTPVYDVKMPCKVRIQLQYQPDRMAESQLFYILPQKPITIITPNSTTSWKIGTSQYITWKNDKARQVNLQYSIFPDSLIWKNIKLSYSSSSGDNSYLWNIPTTITKTTKAKIKIIDAGNSSNYAISDKFTISVPESIKVISPKSGDIWYGGKSYIISWDHSTATTFGIYYRMAPSGSWTTINTYINNQKNYTWQIPTNMTTGSYQIKVADYTGIEPEGISGIFQIISPTIKLTSPTENQAIKANTDFNITWEAKDVNYLKCQYSTDNGSSWSTIFDNQVATATGSYNWKVPNIDAPKCIMRLSDASNPDIQFDVPFSIVKPNVTFNAPTQGVIWLSGTNKTIRWISSNLQYVRLDYSTDGGNSWININSSVFTNNNAETTYSWIVPSISATSTNCYIKITDYYNSNVYFLSPKFTIQKP